MRRITKAGGVLVGIGAGAAAVIWLIKDRLLGPETTPVTAQSAPAFRVSPGPPQTPKATDDDLSLVKGIGPVYRARLEQSNIRTFAALTSASTAAVAKAAQVPEERQPIGSAKPAACQRTDLPYLTAPEELDLLLPGEPAFRTNQLREWLYEHPVLETTDMTNLPTPLRDRLGPTHWPFVVEHEQSADRGRTRKWLFRAPDGAAIEAVLMGYPRRTTLCISSQAGCAMGCTFCATGQFGFERHLEAGEIVAQVAYATASLRADPMPGSPYRVTNVVFMGMGEPLANYRRVRESIRRMIEVMGMSARHITVSTVGVIPGIDRLANEPWPVTLALSLHAADDHLRESLVPLNARYPIDDLMAAVVRFTESKGRRVSLEWTLMDGLNDTPEQARALAAIAREVRGHVNIIPMNPTPLAPQQRPSDDRINRFVAEVERHGANVTLRDTRGSEIDAACGQLRVRSSSQKTEQESP